MPLLAFSMVVIPVLTWVLRFGCVCRQGPQHTEPWARFGPSSLFPATALESSISPVSRCFHPVALEGLGEERESSCPRRAGQGPGPAGHAAARASPVPRSHAEGPGGPAAERVGGLREARAGGAERAPHPGDEREQEPAQGPGGLAPAGAGHLHGEHAGQRGPGAHPGGDQVQGHRGGGCTGRAPGQEPACVRPGENRTPCPGPQAWSARGVCGAGAGPGLGGQPVPLWDLGAESPKGSPAENRPPLRGCSVGRGLLKVRASLFPRRGAPLGQVKRGFFSSEGRDVRDGVRCGWVPGSGLGLARGPAALVGTGKGWPDVPSGPSPKRRVRICVCPCQEGPERHLSHMPAPQTLPWPGGAARSSPGPGAHAPLLELGFRGCYWKKGPRVWGSQATRVQPVVRERVPLGPGEHLGAFSAAPPTPALRPRLGPGLPGGG